MEQSFISLSSDDSAGKNDFYPGNGGMPASAMNTDVHQEVMYAGFWERYAAFFIDGLIIFIVVTGLAFLFRSIGLTVTENRLFEGAINMVISWLYAIVMLRNRQATLGKQALGLMVVSEKPGHLTLGQAILRETLGKFLSTILLGIGYIMAAFTDKKQALHDKIAGTLVVRKDSLAKPRKWIIALAIISAFIVPVIIIGLFGMAVLSGFQSSKGVAYDATAISSLSSVAPEVLLYRDKNKDSLVGFQSINLTALSTEKSNKCFSEPIQNTASNGKSLAIFAKLCADSGKYFCVDSTGQSKKVEETYALGGKTSCVEVANTTGVSIEEKNGGIELKNVSPSKTSANVVPELLPGEDANVFNLAQRINGFSVSKNGYNDFPKNIASEYGEDMELDISPEGKSFVAHQVLQSDPTWSSCIENDMKDAVAVATEAVRRTFHCR